MTMMEGLRLRSTRKYDQFALQSLMQRLRTNLRVTSSDLDGVLLPCLKSAIEDSEAYIGSIIAVSTFTCTERVAGGSSLLSLCLSGPVSSSAFPVVTLDGSAVGGCILDGSVLRVPVASSGTLRVSWTAGMPDIPDNIAHAVILKASYLFDNPVDSVRERVTVADKLLNPFKRFGR